MTVVPIPARARERWKSDIEPVSAAPQLVIVELPMAQLARLHGQGTGVVHGPVQPAGLHRGRGLRGRRGAGGRMDERTVAGSPPRGTGSEDMIECAVWKLVILPFFGAPILIA